MPIKSCVRILAIAAVCASPFAADPASATGALLDASAPLPSSISLFALALAGIGLIRRRGDARRN